jgi:ribosomal protein S27AE
MTLENTLIRSEKCAKCGAEMLWTQNAWPVNGHTEAAYRCLNHHVLDPAETRQCPRCGVHDTRRTEIADGKETFHCFRCGRSFAYPP